MKPFDLEAAKRGAPLCTVDGRDARIVCWDLKGWSNPILALVQEKDGTEEIYSYNLEGEWSSTLDVRTTRHDLAIKTVHHKNWVVLVRLKCSGAVNVVPETFESEDYAREWADKSVDKMYYEVVGISPVEWED